MNERVLVLSWTCWPCPMGAGESRDVGEEARLVSPRYLIRMLQLQNTSHDATLFMATVLTIISFAMDCC